MGRMTNTELQWRLEAAERRIGALNDMIIFMAAHLAHSSPALASELLLEVLALQQVVADWTPEYRALVDRIRQALDGSGFDLDSLR